MLSLSTAAIIEKNSLESDNPWILLFDIKKDGQLIASLCRNTENVQYNGKTYTAFPIKLEEIDENSDGSVSTFTIMFSNLESIFSAVIQQYNGFTDCEIEMTCIFVENDTSSNTFIFSTQYKTGNSIDDGDWLKVTCETFNPHQKQIPRATLRKTLCRYKDFKGERCQYSGTETWCDRSLARCSQLGNEAFFGGSPNIGRTNIYY